MSSNMKDRVIGGLLATIGVLVYVAVLNPLSHPQYDHVPTCWVEKQGTELQAYCGEANQAVGSRFVRFIKVAPDKTERIDK